MLVSFSFYDILKIDEFKDLTIFDLLKKEMDNKVAPYLFALGGNVDLGLKIQACRHRMLNLQSVVGYRYVLLERSDKEWLANKNCSMSARIHSQTDSELASDMVRMSLQGTTESGFRAMCIAAMGKEGTTRSTKSSEEPTWQEDLALMRSLRDIQKDVRVFIHPDENMFDEESALEVVANFESETKCNY